MIKEWLTSIRALSDACEDVQPTATQTPSNDNPKSLFPQSNESERLQTRTAVKFTRKHNGICRPLKSFCLETTKSFEQPLQQTKACRVQT